MRKLKFQKLLFRKILHHGGHIYTDLAKCLIVLFLQYYEKLS